MMRMERENNVIMAEWPTNVFQLGDSLNAEHNQGPRKRETQSTDSDFQVLMGCWEAAA